MTETQPIDPTCLTFWYPKLLAAGLPVPKTITIDAGPDWPHMLGALDSPERHPVEHARGAALIEPVVAGIRAAADQLGGYPVFLRTGQTSGKHSWDRCCYLTESSAVPRHVAALIEFSEMADFMGLCYRYWCVREFLPTIPQAVLPAYGNMPVCREFRFFAHSSNRGGTVDCFHEYWPRKSLEQGFPRKRCPAPPKGAVSLLTETTLEAAHDLPPDFDELCRNLSWLPACFTSVLCALARAAAQALGGAWSVDILETRKGWFITDMAEAGKSFHWPECPNAKEFARERA